MHCRAAPQLTQKDKTGTLTENRMTVVKIMIGNKEYNGEGSGEANSEVSSRD